MASGPLERPFLERHVLIAIGSVPFGGPWSVESYAGSCDGGGKMKRPGIGADEERRAAR